MPGHHLRIFYIPKVGARVGDAIYQLPMGKAQRMKLDYREYGYYVLESTQEQRLDLFQVYSCDQEPMEAALPGCSLTYLGILAEMPMFIEELFFFFGGLPNYVARKHLLKTNYMPVLHFLAGIYKNPAGAVYAKYREAYFMGNYSGTVDYYTRTEEMEPNLYSFFTIGNIHGANYWVYSRRASIVYNGERLCPFGSGGLGGGGGGGATPQAPGGPKMMVSRLVNYL